jgi:hypothetical protein
MALGRGTMLWHHGDNKDTQCEITVLVDQDHDNRSLKKWWSEDLKECCIYDEMVGREDEEEVGYVHSGHVSVSSECVTSWEELWRQWSLQAIVMANDFEKETNSINFIHNIFPNICFLSCVCSETMKSIHSIILHVQTFPSAGSSCIQNCHSSKYGSTLQFTVERVASVINYYSEKIGLLEKILILVSVHERFSKFVSQSHLELK